MFKFRTPLRSMVVLLAGVAVAALASAGHAESITVGVDKPGAKISPLLYGLMTEEINYSYDGGLYAELLRNRIFKEGAIAPGRGRGRGAQNEPGGAPAPIAHWTSIADGGARAMMDLDKSDPINTVALDSSLRLSITSVGNGRAGVANDGYWGIPVKPNTTYKASFYAKAAGFNGPLTVAIETTDGRALASGTIPSVGSKWQKYEVTLKTGGDVRATSGMTVSELSAADGGGGNGGGRGRGGPQEIGHIDTHFVISAKSTGTLWFNLVSLMPPTYNDRPNGNRIDIMDLLHDMKPAFLRFPGGNYVEGNSFPDHYDWRRTLGPLEDRPGHNGTWSYRSTDGMGLLEYLEWCEDLKMEPVLAIFAGHILGNGANRVVTGDALKPYVQEALDEIEYVTGDQSTKWGAIRAKNGHPEPFKLTYIEVGNEDNLSNGLGTYEERFTAFYDAIKGKYPNLKLISTVPSGQRNYNRTSHPDVIDDHYYMNVQQALQTSHHYDNYDRSGPKIFVGEWATRVGAPTPNFNAALADAAFLTGLERNADVVIMASYAPLFVNVNPPYPQYAGGPNYPAGMQWPTDLIGYNGLVSFGSCSYYMQKMFNNNRGDTVLPNNLNSNAVFCSSTRDDATGEIILKLVSGTEAPTPLDITLEGARQVEPNASGWILTGALADMNSIAEPTKVAPKAISINNASNKFSYQLPGNAIVVLRIKSH